MQYPRPSTLFCLLFCGLTACGSDQQAQPSAQGELAAGPTGEKAATEPQAPDAEAAPAAEQQVAMEMVADTSFDDVVGAAQAKQILMDFAAATRGMAEKNKMGLRPARGVLLVGPPGTGKTMLARATAQAAQLPIFAVTAAEFIDWSNGVSPVDRIRSLFAAARKAAPSIVFVDELDALARWPEFAKALGAEVDGFAGNQNVFVIAASNSLDGLPPSLTRSGRFDRVAQVYAPTAAERAELLRRLTQGTAQGPDVDLGLVGYLAEGLTGADLVNLTNLAALRATTLRREAVAAEDWSEAILQLRLGPADDHFVGGAAQRERVAVHEAGHAVAGVLLDKSLQLHEVTLVARGEVLGHTSFLPLEDKVLTLDEDDYRAQIAVALAGQVAERIFFHGSVAGSASDLQHATQVARGFVTTYGMGELGPQGLGFIDDPHATKTLSEATHAAVDAEVQQILRDAYEKVEYLLGRYADAIDQVATALKLTGRLSGQTVKDIVAKVTPTQEPTPR